MTYSTVSVAKLSIFLYDLQLPEKILSSYYLKDRAIIYMKIGKLFVVSSLSLTFILTHIFLSNDARGGPETQVNNCISFVHDRPIKIITGNKEVLGGMIFKSHPIHATLTSKGIATVRFGYSSGEITLTEENAFLKTKCSNESTIYTEKPLTNIIITRKKVVIYSSPDITSAIGLLEEGWRYPVMSLIRSNDDSLWYRISLAGRTGYINYSDVSLDSGIPALNYHHILNEDENINFRNINTTISFNAFLRQMQWLHDFGVTTLTTKELGRWLNREINLPARAVLLTFDDGLKSVHRYAWPVLSRYSMKATLFVITSRIAKNTTIWNPDILQSLSEDELREISMVFSLQSHSDALHNTIGDGTRNIHNYTFQTIERDFGRSRDILERFNPDVFALAWPYGSASERADHAAKNAGFHLGFSIERGKINPGDNLLELKRYYLKENTTRKELISLVDGYEKKTGISHQASKND